MLVYGTWLESSTFVMSLDGHLPKFAHIVLSAYVSTIHLSWLSRVQRNQSSFQGVWHSLYAMRRPKGNLGAVEGGECFILNFVRHSSLQAF